MNTRENCWYRVPEVWLMLVLLGGMIVGSLALAATAMRHNDQLAGPVPHALAAPLPPSSAAQPSDSATP